MISKNQAFNYTLKIPARELAILVYGLRLKVNNYVEW